MENLKKELIDFISWIVKQPKEILSINTRELVEMYLKSINSNAHDESRSVGNNEDKKKKCHKPQGYSCYKLYGGTCDAQDCEYWHF